MINQVRADLLFRSASAVSDGPVSHQDQDMVAMKHAMIHSSNRRILLADHSKLGRVALHRVAGIEELNTLVIDDGYSEEEFEHIADRDVALEVVPVTAERPAFG